MEMVYVPRLAKYCQLEQLHQELEDAFKKADSFGKFQTVAGSGSVPFFIGWIRKFFS